MNLRTRRVLAVVFSILVVTATLTPATAALEPPSRTNADGPLLDLTDVLAGHAVLESSSDGGHDTGNGGGRGPPTTTSTTTTPPGTTTTTTDTGNRTTTTRKNGSDPPGNGSDPPGNGSDPPGNGSDPPGNGSDPPGNGSDPPGNGGGPPDNPGRGPPEDRGPPEWVSNPATPPAVENRSALANRSKALANASVNVTITDDAAAVDYRLAAIDALQNADFDGPGASVERHRTQALEALNDSLPYVLDANRTTAARLFELDKEAGTPPQFAPNVTKLLVHSDAQLATTAIADAERVNATLQVRNVSVNDTAVRENISAAHAAVARAERFRHRGQHHTAISQYRVAWIHAQQALDVMDLATTPNVTITTHEDMPHERNATYTVRGRVFDVRGYELDLTLSLNGANRTVPLSVNATPGAVGTFEANVTLTEQVNRIVVSATDPNRRWSPDYDDANATTGRDLLRLDADGLPDYYERNVTGTDPLDPDSNATHTAHNESDNNVTDGAEDFDTDGATTYTEYRFGLDPLDNDTDDDRLLDGFELQFRGIDPLTAHTDNDSVADPAEDPDNDTLTNLQEQNASTNPVRPDTDGDTLNDSAELANGTDPLARDTDSDGLNDSEELDLGTDPTVADTDGDGTLDGNETFTTEKTDEETGVSVVVTGEGKASQNTNVTRAPEYHNDSAASVGPVVDLDAATTAENTTVSIPYENESDATEMTMFARETGGGGDSASQWHAVESWVDRANGTVIANITGDALVTVLNATDWEQGTSADQKPKRDVTSANISCGSSCGVFDGNLTIGGSPISSSSIEGLGLSNSDESPTENESKEVTEDDWTNVSSSNATLTAGDEESGGLGVETADSDWATNPFSVSVPEDAYTARLEISIDAYAKSGGAARLDVDGSTVYSLSAGPNESKSDTAQRTVWVTEHAGESVEGTLAAKPDGGITIDYTLQVTYDSDGDGVIDSHDVCPDRPGTNPNGCPTRGEGIVTVVVPASAETAELDLTYAAEKNFRKHALEVTIIGQDGREVTRDLASTGGVFTEETFDLSAFNGQAVSLKFDTTAAKLELGDFQLKIDSDGDGIYNHVEAQQWYHPATGNAFSTDPYDDDTDGDGIPDDEEVTFEYDSASDNWDVTGGLSDPSRADTDGDGLDDPEELREDWTVEYTDSPDDTTRFLAALDNGEDPSNQLESDSAETDPTLTDTDGDGLSDSREIELGTNPESIDTDGDGISDQAELQADTDPTLHDYRGPKIDVYRTNFYKPKNSWNTTYQIGFFVEDDSGLDAAAVLKNGDEEVNRDWNPYWTTQESVSTEFSTGAKETILDGLAGATVRIRARDRHNNIRTKVAMERANFWGTVAKELDGTGPEQAAKLGAASGFTTGAGGTAGVLEGFVEDRDTYFDALGELTALVAKYGLVDDVLRTLPERAKEDFQAKQQRNNPYNPDESAERDEYRSFQAGWYLGWVSYHAVSLYLGESAMVQVKQKRAAEWLDNEVEEIARDDELEQVDFYYEALDGRTTDPVKRGSYTLGARLGADSVWLSKQRGQRLLGGAETAAGQVRLYHQLQEIDGYKLDGLSRSQEERLRRVLAHTGDDGAEAINRLDSDTIETLLALDATCTSSGLSIQQYGGNCLEEETIEDAVDSVVKATNEGGVSEEEIRQAVQRIDATDGVARNRALRVLADADSDAIKLITRLDADVLSKLVKNTDEIRSVGVSDDVLTVDAERHGMDVTVKYPDDGEEYVRTEGGVGDKDLSDLSDTEKGDIAEEEIGPKLARERGYDVRDPFDTGTDDTGFDVVAYDSDAEEWVIIEAKFKTKGGSISKDTWLDDTETKGRQMTDEWIEETLKEMRKEATTEDQLGLVRELQQAYDTESLRKEYVAVQSADVDGQTVLPSLNDVGITRVDVVKLGDVIPS